MKLLRRKPYLIVATERGDYKLYWFCNEEAKYKFLRYLTTAETTSFIADKGNLVKVSGMGGLAYVV